MKKSVLCHFYRDLTGDRATLSEKEVDERLSALFELEEPDLIYDLRDVNPGNQSNHYGVFWSKAKEFLEEDVGTAVDDRRHTQTFMLQKLFLYVISSSRLNKGVHLKLLFHVMSWFDFSLYLHINPTAQHQSTLPFFK